jgi:hypothetical protein
VIFEVRRRIREHRENIRRPQSGVDVGCAWSILLPVDQALLCLFAPEIGIGNDETDSGLWKSPHDDDSNLFLFVV